MHVYLLNIMYNNIDIFELSGIVNIMYKKNTLRL